MPSSTTIFRAAVMLAIGVGAYKGWQMYGPPTEKVKSLAVRALDVAQAAWQNFQKTDKDARAAATKPAAAPPFAQTGQPARPSAGDMSLVPPPLSTQTLTPNSSLGSPPIGSAPSPQAAITPLEATSASTNVPSDDRVHTLISRLEQLGGSDPKIAPWGSSGRLFRCSCQAPLANSSAVKQHFESVAVEPALAVEQVVAKVEAWQTARRNSSVLR
jgi:hypothetical protein